MAYALTAFEQRPGLVAVGAVIHAVGMSSTRFRAEVGVSSKHYYGAMADTIDTYRTVTPYLVVVDADAELRFLAAAFGATEQSVGRRPDGAVMHAEIVIGDSLIMIGQGSAQWPPKSGALYLWVPDVDAAYTRALAAGATSESAPEDKPYGHRNAGVIDTNGITWWIGSPVK